MNIGERIDSSYGLFLALVAVLAPVPAVVGEVDDDRVVGDAEVAQVLHDAGDAVGRAAADRLVDGLQHLELGDADGVEVVLLRAASSCGVFCTQVGLSETSGSL